MHLVAAAILLCPFDPPQQDFQEADRPFKLAGMLLAVEGIMTHFGDDPGFEDAPGLMGLAQLRMGEIYYYRLAGYLWDAEEENGDEVDLYAGSMGLGMDLSFGAFRDFAFDAGAGLGLLHASGERDEDTGFYFQVEATLRWKIAHGVGLRVSGMIDWVNLHFNSDDTEDFADFSVGGGVELSF